MLLQAPVRTNWYVCGELREGGGGGDAPVLYAVVVKPSMRSSRGWNFVPARERFVMMANRSGGGATWTAVHTREYNRIFRIFIDQAFSFPPRYVIRDKENPAPRKVISLRRMTSLVNDILSVNRIYPVRKP